MDDQGRRAAMQEQQGDEDESYALAIEASCRMHELDREEQDQINLALQRSLQEEEELLWALEQSSAIAQPPPPQPLPQSPQPSPSSARRAQRVPQQPRPAPRTPAVPHTPTTTALMDEPPSPASHEKPPADQAERGGLNIKPARSNPARQRRQRLQTSYAGPADGVSPRSSDASPRASTTAEAPPSQRRPPPNPRQGPPNAAPTHTEHASWRLPELPPPAQWAAVDARADAAPIVVWLRQEMRMADNPALSAAAATHRPVLPVFILADDSEEGGWPMGGAAKLWQHHALIHLQHAMRGASSALLLRDGRHHPTLCSTTATAADANAGADAGSPSGGGSLLELLTLVQQSGAGSVYWNRCYEPWRCERDAAIASTLRGLGVEVREFVGSCLYEPWDARPDERSSQMGFGSVGFFLNACSHLPEPPEPLPAPTRLQPPRQWPPSVALSSLGLVRWPRRPDGAAIDWAHGIRTFWACGEAAAHEALEAFLAEGIHRFEGRQRHRADERNTSLISPFIRFGELSARQVLHRLREGVGARRPPSAYLRKLAWRDLAYWALWRFPTLADAPFRPHFAEQPWESDPKLLDAWQRGRTGYPLVDAAMTQLWHVGWMPNYMRHVVAGFLVEFLNLDWCAAADLNRTTPD